MLLWAGIAFILIGLACFGIDRRASHLLYDHVGARFRRFLDRTTHAAKASHWIVIAVLAAVVTRLGFPADLQSRASGLLGDLLASLMLGSVVLHAIKLVAGRRRPRDDLEMGLYGFKRFAFDTRYNSFPSGHALTIMCVATVASVAWPSWAPAWFALALWLGLTRAFLTAHYLSDVFVGAGIGLISARESVIHLFPQLTPMWF